PPPPSSIRLVDARLEALILRMLEKEPASRPASMRELRADLRALSRPPSLKLHDVGAGASERSAPSEPPSTPSARIVSQEMAAVSLPPHVVAAQLAKEPVSTLRESLSTIERF